MTTEAKIQVKSMAAQGPESNLEAFEYEINELGPKDVLIAVEYCGICHSDLSMWKNHWGMTSYPFVPGHEVVGRVEKKGELVTELDLGQRVGLGWMSKSCMSCSSCMSGNHNLCYSLEQTIVGRYGGFANKVSCSVEWAIPIPEGLDPKTCGPLFCAGITVFNPLIQMNLRPTDRVGVIGIGGLGHLALQFLNRWGCELVAFSHSPHKEKDALNMGANHFVSSTNTEEMQSLLGSFDCILSTVNQALDWENYLQLLAPQGRFHTVGAIAEPLSVQAFSLIAGQKSISGSPLGSPFWTKKMLDFAQRHQVEALVETFPMSQVSQAMSHLESGKAKYRIVLENDLDS